MMRAAVFTAPQRIEIAEARLPDPGPGQVRVRLEGCGVCASNLPVWEGRPWFEYPLPAGKPGHEGWGVVDAVGRGVAHLREGERVALLSEHAYAEYDVSSADAVIALPASLAQRPFPGEPLGCAVNVFRRSDIKRGQTVAIVGVGFLGAVLTGLIARSGTEVIAISRRVSALRIAAELGAQCTLPLADMKSVIAEVMARTKGAGCERVIEATGEQRPLDLATDIARVRGRLVIAGYHQDGMRRVNMQKWNWNGLDVINAHERNPEVYISGIRGAVAAIAEGRLDPQPLLTHSLPLEHLADAFELMRQRPEGFLKAVVVIKQG